MGTTDSTSLVQKKSNSNERGFIWVPQRLKNKHKSIPKRRNRLNKNNEKNFRYTRR